MRGVVWEHQGAGREGVAQMELRVSEMGSGDQGQKQLGRCRCEAKPFSNRGLEYPDVKWGRGREGAVQMGVKPLKNRYQGGCNSHVMGQQSGIG